MEFVSQWITSSRFAGLCKTDDFHKELTPGKVSRAGEGIIADHTWFCGSYIADGAADYFAYVSADDYYKLYVNGSFVCQGPAPGYPFLYRFNKIDLGGYIKPNHVNKIALHVFYQGLVNRVWNSGDNRQGCIFDLYKNGEWVFGSSDGWICRRAYEYGVGERIGYDTAFTENIDFRLKDNRDKLGEGDGWESAVVDPDHGHVFADAPTPVLEINELNPERVVGYESGKLFIDFGREIVGQLNMRLKGRAGDTVTVICGEETDGYNVRGRLRALCNYTETLTLSGNIDVPEFYDYKAFRYVNLISDKPTDIDGISAIVRHYPFDDSKGLLETNDPRLGSVWTLCRDTLKYATQEGFLDCPTREKGQYLGDFTVSGLAWLCITGDRQPYLKTLSDFAASAAICPGLMAVAPGSHMQEIADFSLQYPLQLLNYYRHTGDAESVSRFLPTVDGIIAHFSEFKNENRLLVGVTDKWNIVDWPPNLRDGYDCGLENPIAPDTLHNVVNAYYIGALICRNKLHAIVGDRLCDDFSEVIVEYEKAFYDTDRRLYADRPLSYYRETGRKPHHSLHSNVIPAFYGFLKKDAYDSVASMIEEKGFFCGVQFAYFVLKACAAIGRYDLEYLLAVNDGENSWLNMLREGATTLFEAWGKDKKWNTSLCHPWAAAPVIAVCEDLAKHPPEGVIIKINK